MQFLMVFDFTQFWLDGRPGNEYFWISHKISDLLTTLTHLGVRSQWFETDLSHSFYSGTSHHHDSAINWFFPFIYYTNRNRKQAISFFTHCIDIHHNIPNNDYSWYQQKIYGFSYLIAYKKYAGNQNKARASCEEDQRPNKSPSWFRNKLIFSIYILYE